MKKFLLLFFTIFSAASAFSQERIPGNLELLSNVNDYNTGLRSYNDVWGYVDRNGREYAILGGRNSTIIYDIANPREPVEVANIPGPSSIWRDAKSFGDYVYVVTDRGEEGLTVINMSEAPNNITYTTWTPIINTLVGPGRLGRCHNLFIDENGICYVSGCTVGGGGVLMFDLTSNPRQPPFIGAASSIYSHDNYTRGDTIYTADLNIGAFRVIDVRNKLSPQVLASQNTTRTFTHNTWLSDDGDFLFTTDERPNANVDAYDISDLDNIELIDTYRPLSTINTGVIPHNVHYYNGFLVISYYSSGLRIVDAHRPHNLIEVGFYDTNPKVSSDDGCWGAFPFLPSGNVLASDMDFGLFVLKPDYQRACYLEGLVTDATTGNPLAGVDVEIISNNLNSGASNPDGTYATGQQVEGSFDVVFSREEYRSKTVSVTLVSGEVTVLDVELEKIGITSISGSVVNQMDGSGLAGAIRLESENESYEIAANEDGSFTLPEIRNGTYDIFAGAWGFKQKQLDPILLEGSNQLFIELEPGEFEDDFVVDQGWTTESTAITGAWEREIPIGTFNDNVVSNPDQDVEGDLGGLAYITGNGEGELGDFDIDGGEVRLMSPIMDLTGFDNPVLSYAKWFYNAGGDSDGDDEVRTMISNGDTIVDLEIITENTTAWDSASFDLIDIISLTSTMQFMVVSGDLGAPHLVEAGIDAFRLVDNPATSSEDILALEAQLTTFPNPFTRDFSLQYELPQSAQSVSLSIFNQLGQELERYQLNDRSGQIQLGENLPAGVYFVQLSDTKLGQLTRRVVKQE